MVDKTVTIKHICKALLEGRNTEAKKIARNQYPFQPLFRKRRNYSLHQSMQVFVRDGFIDRYSGQRLIFPGVLRLLSIFLPDEFPFQKNWKMTETHIAYWELYPTIDHVVPIARGGNDDKSNWVTTSMLRNTAKSNWTLSELGWVLLQPGKMTTWDGFTYLFLDFIDSNSAILNDNYIKRWHRAAIGALEKI